MVATPIAKFNCFFVVFSWMNYITSTLEFICLPAPRKPHYLKQRDEKLIFDELNLNQIVLFNK